MQQLCKHSLILFFTLALLAISLEASAQYARGNSPYSRYGLGDLRGSNFAPNAAMSGGQAAIYRSYWDVNLANPASYGKLRLPPQRIEGTKYGANCPSRQRQSFLPLFGLSNYEKLGNYARHFAPRNSNTVGHGL